MKNKILPIIFSLVIGGFHQAYAGVEITGMRCEYLVSPLGIDAVHPRFTWEYRGDDVPDEIPVLELSVVLPAGVTATVLPGTSAGKTVAGTRNKIINI